jgi:Icc-related predicted phosphoesterase
MSLFGWKTKRDADSKTKLFFASDFHGSERTFRKFINSAKHYGVDVLVMGGDIIGKMAIPIIRESADAYRAHLQGKTERFKGEEELKSLLARLETLGFYSQVMDVEEYQALQQDSGAVDRLFHQLARKRLASWIELAETRLKDSGVKCYVIGGNDDYPDVLELFGETASQSMIYCENRTVDIDAHHQMVSFGFSNPTPWNTPREMKEEDIGPILEKLVGGLGSYERAIFNIHVPPMDSSLDTCPMLNWETDPPSQIVKGGQVVLYGAGSAAVRRTIEEHQPLLSLHGHIHESGGVVRIGRTTSVNPGSEYGEGVLRGCLVTLGRDEVRHYQMTAG